MVLAEEEDAFQDSRYRNEGLLLTLGGSRASPSSQKDATKYSVT